MYTLPDMTMELEPKMEYTFFPDKNEEEAIKQASAEEVADFMVTTPDLTPAYLHELWRKHREADIYQALSRSGKNPLVFLALFGDDMISSLSLMSGEYRVPIEDCQSFASDVYQIITKVGKQIPIDQDLEPIDQEFISKATSFIMAKTNETVAKYKAS